MFRSFHFKLSHANIGMIIHASSTYFQCDINLFGNLVREYSYFRQIIVIGVRALDLQLDGCEFDSRPPAHG